MSKKVKKTGVEKIVDAKAVIKPNEKKEKRKKKKRQAVPAEEETVSRTTAPVDIEISNEKLTRAVSAMLKHVQTETEVHNPLIDANDETLTLQFNLLNMPGNRTKTKFIRAHQIRLPHPMFGGKTQKTCCLFVRNAPKDKPDFWKKWHEQNPIPGLTKVMPVKKLKGKYRYFDAKRDLAQRFDLFLVDQVVANMMPNLLGSTFLQKKHKVPNPVDIGKIGRAEKYKKNVIRAMESVQCRVPSSASGAVKVGRANMTCEQLVENIKTVYKHVSSAFYEKYGIRSLCLTATGCPGLPLWELPKEKTQVIEFRKRKIDEESSDDGSEEDASSSSEDELKDAPLPLLRKKKAKTEKA